MGIFDSIKKKISGLKPTQKKEVKKTVIKAEEERKEEKKPKHTSLKLKSEEKAPTAEPKAGKRAKATESKEAYRILIKPLITEKATHLVTQNKYSFAVAKSVNKNEVKKAIEGLYGVEPIDINIINVRGKFVRYGRTFGKKKNWKKAIITLKPGDKIDIYEGV